jgi:translocation and assembly module TamB
MSLLMLGTVNLQLAQLFNPDISSSGQVRFNINSFGATENPDVQGQVQILNANLASGSVPIGLANGNGVLTLTKDRLNIAQFTGSVGGGTLTASGGVVYKPSLKFDLAVQGRKMRFLYPLGVREAVDTDLSLSGTMDASLLSGQVRLEQLQFTPDFDLTNLTGQFSGETTPPPSGGMTQNMKLNVAIQSAGGINAVSRTASLQAVANLHLQGTADQPVVLGRVTVNGGDMIFMGNRYVLQSGTIDFVNPVRTEPMVNLSVSTTIQQYDIHLRFEGPVEQLRANYSSEPALPPADIISLLAFGKTSEASAANPTPGSLAAQSAIASQVSSQVTSRIQKIAGISQLSIDPVLGGQAQGQNPGARITIQQRVTSNLFVTFATDVTSTQRDVIQVQYKITPRVTFSGTRDQNGGFGFDTRIRKTW